MVKKNTNKQRRRVQVQSWNFPLTFMESVIVVCLNLFEYPLLNTLLIIILIFLKKKRTNLYFIVLLSARVQICELGYTNWKHLCDALIWNWVMWGKR